MFDAADRGLNRRVWLRQPRCSLLTQTRPLLHSSRRHETPPAHGCAPRAFGAADRGRTGTVLLPRDFKSLVSAYSTTAANVWGMESTPHIIAFFGLFVNGKSRIGVSIKQTTPRFTLFDPTAHLPFYRRVIGGIDRCHIGRSAMRTAGCICFIHSGTFDTFPYVL